MIDLDIPVLVATVLDTARGLSAIKYGSKVDVLEDQGTVPTEIIRGTVLDRLITSALIVTAVTRHSLYMLNSSDENMGS